MFDYNVFTVVIPTINNHKSSIMLNKQSGATI